MKPRLLKAIKGEFLKLEAVRLTDLFVNRKVVTILFMKTTGTTFTETNYDDSSALELVYFPTWTVYFL